MKSRHAKKIAAMAVLAAIACLAISWIASRAGQAQPAAAAGDLPGGPPVDGGVTIVSTGSEIISDVAPAPGEAEIPEGAVRGVSGGNFIDPIQVDGNQVVVSGRAFVKRAKPGTRYVWAVRVLSSNHDSNSDPDKDLLFEQLYPDLACTVPGSGELDEPFADELAIPLAAGTYHLELTWYAVPPDAGMEMLTDPAFRARNKAPGGAAAFTIAR